MFPCGFLSSTSFRSFAATNPLFLHDLFIPAQSPPEPQAPAMYTLTPNSYLLRAPHRSATCRTVAALHAPSAPAIATPPAASDPTLRSTGAHRAWVTAGFATILATLTRSAAAAADTGSVTEPLLAAAAGYILADLATGIYHWAVDNYGNLSTPIFGAQIEAFQGHHRQPWTITRRDFANNLHALARSVALVVTPIELLSGGDAAAVHAFVGVCAGCILLSQQFHAWAHTPRGRLPAAVAALQDAGLLISTARHGKHHRPPYNDNYCIVSGVWNGVLDELRVFEAMEMVLFFRFGVRPRSWSEPGLSWVQEAGEESEEAVGLLP